MVFAGIGRQRCGFLANCFCNSFESDAVILCSRDDRGRVSDAAAGGGGSRLDRIIDLTHALVKLSRAIDWRFLEVQFGSVYSDGPVVAATMRQPITSSGFIRRPEAPAHTADQTRVAAARRYEPVIGHLKAEHPMGRNYLAHHAGDAVNAVLAAAGYNFHLLLRWLEFLAVQIPGASESSGRPSMGLKIETFTDDEKSQLCCQQYARAHQNDAEQGRRLEF